MATFSIPVHVATLLAYHSVSNGARLRQPLLACKLLKNRCRKHSHTEVYTDLDDRYRYTAYNIQQ